MNVQGGLITLGNVGIGTTSLNSKFQIGNESDSTADYLQIATNNGIPASADCDSDTERGRTILEYSNNRL